jgi:hypothetical protein
VLTQSRELAASRCESTFQVSNSGENSMLRGLFFFTSAAGMLAAVLFAIAGCSSSSGNAVPVQPTASSLNAGGNVDPTSVSAAAQATAQEEEHGHKPGAHGGIIVSLGRDSYHVEAIVTSSGELRLYTLGNDESRVIDVAIQSLIAYVKPTGGLDSTSLEIKPQPQPGDSAGKASLFVAQLPDELVGQNIDVTVPNITIGGERFRLGFTTKSDEHGETAMPAKVANDEERQLYLTPGGIYTQADIEANGNVTASQKFAAFQAAHDLNPKLGDKICPVTLTKANPKCSWIVGGKNYEFCCPPCVDEFVKLAKSKPEEVKEPEHYVKRDAQTQVK